MLIRRDTSIRVQDGETDWKRAHCKGIWLSLVLIFLGSALSVNGMSNHHVISVSPVSIDFGNQPIALQPSQNFQLSVNFTPTAQINYSATVAISSYVPVDSVVAVAGAGGAPNISVSPTTAIVQAGKSHQFTWVEIRAQAQSRATVSIPLPAMSCPIHR